MGKILVLLVILAVGLSRWLITRGKGKAASYMLLSLFIQTLPFGYGKAIYVFLQGALTADDRDVRLGEFGNLIRVEMPLLFALLFLFFGIHKMRKGAFSFNNNRWLYILGLFSLISALNPFNPHPFSFLALLIPLLQFLILFKLIEANFSKNEILLGFFDGIAMTSLLQLTLAICYPVLGMESVAGAFRGQEAFEWAQRRGMSSAIGTFGHPSHLAIYCLIFISFFLSCYFNGYQKKKAFYMLIINVVILILAFSRISIVCGIITIPILILLYRNYGRFLSFRNAFYFGILGLVSLVLLYLSPIGYLFFENDSETQLNNRFIHWALGYQIWEKSKLFGIGVNSHVYYMLYKLRIVSDIPAISFFVRSPVHNIHMIVLAETGLAGMFAWLYYFFNRLKNVSKKCRTADINANIFNLSFVGVLCVIFLYGFFGWAPFTLEIYSLAIVFGYFSDSTVTLRKKRFIVSNVSSSIEPQLR